MPNMPLLNRLAKTHEIEGGMLLLAECQALKQKGCKITLMASELSKMLSQEQLNLLGAPITAAQIERLLWQCAADLIEKRLDQQRLSQPQHQLLTLIEHTAIRIANQPFRTEDHIIAEKIIATLKLSKKYQTA